MDRFLQIIGWLAVVTISAYITFIFVTKGIEGGIQSLLVGLPGIVSAVVLAAFGSMLETLREIRKESALQTDLLRRFISKT